MKPALFVIILSALLLGSCKKRPNNIGLEAKFPGELNNLASAVALGIKERELDKVADGAYLESSLIAEMHDKGIYTVAPPLIRDDGQFARDLWGEEIQIRDTPKTLELRSSGPDKLPSTNDDVHVVIMK